MEEESLNNKTIMKISTFNSLTIKEHIINKILLLRNTNNLVCSYGEDCQVEIFSLNFDELGNNEKYKSLQIILDPHYYSIEYILETKPNSNNKNYLLVCSDMIHVFYLYNNDKKSILLQSINEFSYRFIYQVIELRNGNLISYSNEYKISVFSNLLIENNDYVDDINDLIKNNNYKKEIYELEKDKINKKNEIILYLLELFPNKFAYCYKIDDGEFTRFLNNDPQEGEEQENENEEGDEIDDEDINNKNDNYIYIKFMDKKYDIITELEICKVNKDIYNMFQYNENLMVFINTSFLSLIDLKYYEIVSKIQTNRINFAYFFASYLIKQNFINYLFLRVKSLEETLSSESENNSENENNEEEDDNSNNNDLSQEDNDNISMEGNNIIEEYGDDEVENNINFYDLNNLKYGIKRIKCINNNDQEINLNEYISSENLLEISIISDNKNKNISYLTILNKDLSISFSKIKINIEN